MYSIITINSDITRSDSARLYWNRTTISYSKNGYRMMAGREGKNWLFIVQLFVFSLIIVSVPGVSTAQQKIYTCVISCCTPGWVMSKKDQINVREDDLYGLGMNIYYELARRMAERGVNLKLLVVPLKRSVKLFDSGKVDMMFAAVLRRSSVSHGKSFQSFPYISPGGYLIFTRKDQPKLSEVKQLEHKRVGVVAGFGLPAGATKNKKIKFLEVRRGVQNFRMLEAGRIDAILTFARIGLSTMKKSGVSKIHYGKEFKKLYVGARFPDKKDTDLLLIAANISIAEMFKDGTYEKLFRGNENQSILPLK